MPSRRSNPTRIQIGTDPRVKTAWTYFGHYELEGELMCESGQPSAGLAHLLRVENILDRHASPNSPVLARLRAVTGLCALSLGNRKQAEIFRRASATCLHCAAKSQSATTKNP